MIVRDIERPFGEDEDANRSVASVLSIVSRLSVETRKLATTDFRDINAEASQRTLVLDLHERIASSARRVHVDTDELLEAARKLLEHRTRRKIVLYPVRQGRAGLGDRQRQLDGELLHAEESALKARAALARAQTRLDNAEAGVRIARLAVQRHRAQRVGRAAA